MCVLGGIHICIQVKVVLTPEELEAKAMAKEEKKKQNKHNNMMMMTKKKTNKMKKKKRGRNIIIARKHTNINKTTKESRLACAHLRWAFAGCPSSPYGDRSESVAWLLCLMTFCRMFFEAGSRAGPCDCFDTIQIRNSEFQNWSFR